MKEIIITTQEQLDKITRIEKDDMNKDCPLPQLESEEEMSKLYYIRVPLGLFIRVPKCVYNRWIFGGLVEMREDTRT